MKTQYSSAVSLILFLGFALLITGCAPQQTVKSSGSSFTSKSSPLYDTTYSKKANDEFVMGTKSAEAYVANKALGSMQDKFKSESASLRTRQMADWILRTRDNRNMPFAIVDKVNAKVYAFSADGQLYGAAPVLLGMAKGDTSIPGIGNMPLSQIKPSQRTTPAGRFVSQIGRNHKGKEILWVDYDEALSLHPVANVPGQNRPKRLASITSSDNRISWGCINVPKPFFKNVISDKFSGKSSVVYIMPETKNFRKS